MQDAQDAAQHARDARDARAPEPRRADPATARFREQALTAYDRGEGPAAALNVSPPSVWILFFIFAALIASALSFCMVGHIEVTATGRGALRTAGGVISIQAEIGGPIAEVRVRSGQAVKAGQVLVVIDAASIQASLLEAEKRVAFVEGTLGPSAERRLANLRERQRLLAERADLIRQRIKRQDESTARHERHRRDSAVLQEQGYVGRHQQDDAEEVVTEARTRLLSLKQELTQCRTDQTALEGEEEVERMTLAEQTDQARSRREAAALMLRQTSITAPRDGVVEAIVVRPGELVTPGAAIGKLVPPGTPAQVIAFVNERDRAFLHAGSRVRLEVDQLPVGEFGPLTGTVARVGDDLASASEIRDALGETAAPPGPQYRVEIGIDQAPAGGRVRPRVAELRAPMLVTVRYKLRQRRIITLALQPLRKWLD